MGETPRLRTDLVDKVLLDAVAAGLKSNKKVIRTGKGPRLKQAKQQYTVPQKLKSEIKQALRAKDTPVEVTGENQDYEKEQLVMVGPTVLTAAESRSTMKLPSSTALGREAFRYRTARNSIDAVELVDESNRAADDREKASTFIDKKMDGKDLCLEADNNRSRDSPLGKWHPKFDTDQYKEVPSVVYEDDSIEDNRAGNQANQDKKGSNSRAVNNTKARISSGKDLAAPNKANYASVVNSVRLKDPNLSKQDRNAHSVLLGKNFSSTGRIGQQQPVVRTQSRAEASKGTATIKVNLADDKARSQSNFASVSGPRKGQLSNYNNLAKSIKLPLNDLKDKRSMDPYADRPYS